MKRMDELDRNFKINTNIQRDGLRFYDAESDPFRIYGVFREGDRFRRMPEKIARSVSEGVAWFHSNTAGGRVRFVTDSPYVAISARMDKIVQMPHFAFTGSSGFDLYTDAGQGQQYERSFIPPLDMKDGYESMIDFSGGRKKRIITINFPPYCDVKKLWVGLEEGAVLKRSPDYAHEEPIIYYGSSITHGACTSRPGNTYQAIISRRTDSNYVNLGFGGNAKGELAMAEYLASLKMRALVLNYDYNAPTVEHLMKTHEAMFRCVRNAQPDIPIIITTRPRFRLTEEEQARFAVARRTYENAICNADCNVYFAPGNELIPESMEEIATVDACHPNDCGAMCIANALEKVFERIAI